jgi:hypothetical protein
LAGRGNHTIDLGDVNVDDLAAEAPAKPESEAAAEESAGFRLDLFGQADAGEASEAGEPFEAARQLNPQRPHDPEDLSPPTGLGFPPVTTATEPEEGIFVGSGPRQILESLKWPLVGLVALVAVALVVPEDFWSSFFGGESLSIQNADPSMDEPMPRQPAMSPRPEPPSEPRVAESVNQSGDPNTLSPISQELLGNPYWPLPNRLQLREEAVSELTPALESRWRRGLAHRYVYQRYQTVQEIRQRRIRGAAFLLFEALNQPKFWTRMEALFGLAEVGLKIDVDTVADGLGEVRPSLVANYFKRFFATRPTAGELYVMRQAIRLVDADGRLNILRVLGDLGGDINQMYLVAANYDPSRSIQGWLETNRRQLRVSSRNIERYHQLIRDYLANEDSAVDQPQIQELKVEELSESSIVNEVQFFQELIDNEEEAIVEPESILTDGFEDLQ